MNKGCLHDKRKPLISEGLMMAKKKTGTETAQPVIAFKGFDRDLKCRDFQFEVGKTYTHTGEVAVCKSGFHACENPLDVWGYYGPFESRFAVVEVSGKIERHAKDSKVCAASLHVKAELKLPDFIKSAVQFVIDACEAKPSKETVSEENYAQLAASGYDARLAASGYSAKLAASGDFAQLAASGHYARLAASGGYAKLAASGGYAKLAASGDYAKLAVTGDNGVIASSSRQGVAKGKAGTWIALAEFDRNGKCVGFATGKAGEDGVPADKWLKASRGKLVEIEA